MKLTYPLLDRDDRAALSRLVAYSLLFLGALLALLLTAAVAGLCVRVFEALS